MHHATTFAHQDLNQHCHIGTAGFQDAVVDPSHAWRGDNVDNVTQGNGTIAAEGMNLILGMQHGVDPLLAQNQPDCQADGNIPAPGAVHKTCLEQVSVGGPVGEPSGTHARDIGLLERSEIGELIASRQGLAATKPQDSQVVGVQSPEGGVPVGCAVVPRAERETATLKALDTPRFSLGPLELDNILPAANPVETGRACEGAATTPISASFRCTSPNLVGQSQLNLITPTDAGSSALSSKVSAAMPYQLSQSAPLGGGDAGNPHGNPSQSASAALPVQQMGSSNDILRRTLPTAACTVAPLSIAENPQPRKTHSQLSNPSGRTDIGQPTIHDTARTIGTEKPLSPQLSRLESIEKDKSVGDAARGHSTSLDRVSQDSVIGSGPSLSAKANNGNGAVNKEGNLRKPVEGRMMPCSELQKSTYQGKPTVRPRAPAASNLRSIRTNPQITQKWKTPRRRVPRGGSKSAATLGNKPPTVESINKHSDASIGKANVKSGQGFAIAQESEPGTSHALEPKKQCGKRSRKSVTPTQEKRAKRDPRRAEAALPAPEKSAALSHSKNMEMPGRSEKSRVESCERIGAMDETNEIRPCFSQKTAKGGRHHTKVSLDFMKPTQLDLSLPPQYIAPVASRSSYHLTQQLPQSRKPASVVERHCKSTSPLQCGGPSDAKSVMVTRAPIGEPQKCSNPAPKIDSAVEGNFASTYSVRDNGELVPEGEVRAAKKDDAAMEAGPSALSARPLPTKSLSCKESPTRQKNSQVTGAVIDKASPGLRPASRNIINATSTKLLEFSQLTQTESPGNTKGTDSTQQQQISPSDLKTPQPHQKSSSKEDTLGKQIAGGNVTKPKCRDLKTDLGRKPACAVLARMPNHTSFNSASSSPGSVASSMEGDPLSAGSGMPKLNLTSTCAHGRAGNNADSGIFQKPCATEFFEHPTVQAVTTAPDQNAVSERKPARASIPASNAAHFVQKRATVAGGLSSSTEALASASQLPSETNYQPDKEKATAQSPKPSPREKSSLTVELQKATADALDEGVLDKLATRSPSTSSEDHFENQKPMKAAPSRSPAKERSILNNPANLQTSVASGKITTAREIRLDPSSGLPKQAEKGSSPSADKEDAPPTQAARLAALAERRCADQAAKVAPSGEGAAPSPKPSIMLRLRIRKGTRLDKNGSSSARQPKSKKSSRRTRRAAADKAQNCKTKQGTGIQDRSCRRTNLGVSQERKLQKVQRNESRVLRKRKDADGDLYMDYETETDNSTLRTKASKPPHGNVCESPERQTESSSSIPDPAGELNRRVSEVGHPRTLPSPVKLQKARTLPRKPAVASIQMRKGIGHEDDTVREKIPPVDCEESRILRKRSLSDDRVVLEIGLGVEFGVKCALCQKPMSSDENSKHPLFPLRSLIICRECHVSIRSSFDERHGHIRAEKCRLFVGVVEEMIRGLPPSHREAAKLTGVYSSLVSERCESVLKRARSHPVPYEMLLVMRAIFVKIGLMFKHGKLVVPTDGVMLPASEDLRFLIAEAIPRSLSDFEVGSTAGERAWLAVFGEEFRLDQPMPSCRMIARVLSLVDVRTEHCGECRWSSSSIQDCCSVRLDVTDIDQLFVGASSIKTSIRDVIPSVKSYRAATRTQKVREREVQDDLIFGSTDMSCCICTASQDSEGFPFRMLHCGTCPRMFCSICLTNVLGSVEYIRASTAAASYSCMVCRTMPSRSSTQRNGFLEGVDGGIKKRPRQRRGGVRSNFLPMLLLSSSMRRELQFTQDRSMSNPKIRFAKQCEALNFKQLSYVNGEGRKSRSIPDELCLRCRQPVRPSQTEEINGNSPSRKTIRDETVLKCTERNCAVVMHRSCHTGRKSNKTRGSFSGMVCPRHKCKKCQGKAEVKLLRCRTCPATFCRDHVEPRQIHIYSDKFIACADCKPNLSVPQMSIHRAAPMMRIASETPYGNDILGSLSLRQRQRQVAVQRQVGDLGQM